MKLTMGLSMVLLQGAPIAIFSSEPRERVDERGRRRGGGPARGILHALDQLAVVALALGQGRGRGREYDDVDLGVGELAAFGLELQHAAHLFFRRDVAVGDASGVQGDDGGNAAENSGSCTVLEEGVSKPKRCVFST